MHQGMLSQQSLEDLKACCGPGSDLEEIQKIFRDHCINRGCCDALPMNLQETLPPLKRAPEGEAASSVHLFNPNGQARGAVTGMTDTSDELRFGQLKSEFVSTVSHELRTPLTVIQGSLSLLLGSAAGNVPPKMIDLLSIAHRNVDRLIKLINDILDIEKINHGQMDFQKTSVDLRRLAANGLTNVLEGSGCKDTRLHLVPGHPVTAIQGDPVRLQQVLANLLSNAIKFAPPNLPIHIDVIETAAAIEVAVIDQGPGISESFKSTIFEPFTQADSSDSRHQGGTGLGLSISRSIISQHGGTLGFTNLETGGCRFYFRLPLQADTLPPNTHSVEETKVASLILIADENTERGKLLGRSLRKEGYQAQLNEDISCAIAEILIGNADVLAIHRSSLKTALSAAPFATQYIEEEEPIPSIMPTILYIEDDSGLQTILKERLLGIADTRMAPTLAAARRLIHRERFDAIVLDQHLPDGSGLDFATILQTMGDKCPPIVLFSAQEAPIPLPTNIKGSLVKSRASIGDLIQALQALF